MQRTVSEIITVKGVGLHSGQVITLSIKPAGADEGITFIRTDVTEGDNAIPALWDHVVDTQLCTVIGNEDGVRVGTIEHLMSALRGAGIDNALIELDGSEVPVMDGSAAPFLELIEETGAAVQPSPRRIIKVLKEVSVERDGKRVTLSPAENSVFAGEIAFDHQSVGTQRYEVELFNGNYRHEIAAARTFGFLHEVEWMRSQGLALGGSLDNAVVLGPEGVMNPDGLRFEDEFIRHKLLDAIGDLYLAGLPIMGAYDGVKAGHAINNEILKALFADKDAYEVIELCVDPFARAGESEYREVALVS
ncbi:MAG: UDP-3-O-acyl-N-acetylglucosamine deacetylase [Alphaproteobacteria bacterium]